MKARSRRLRLSRAVIFWAAAFAAGVALKIWLHLQMTEVGYQLTQLRHVAMLLGQERSQLEAERATLTSPQALDAISRSRLGLHPPQGGQVIALP